MRCPHCTVDFHVSERIVNIGADADGDWGVATTVCPACRRMVVRLLSGRFDPVRKNWSQDSSRTVRPKAVARVPLSTDVPDSYAADYREACNVIADSPKASAALSRRCLQHLLREKAQVKPSDLYNEIQELLDRGSLPSHIADSVDAVRNIGNFAAHPIKSKASGEIVPVEPGEAEWNLDVLESLFDFYFVAPARTKARKDALNKKLAEAGKPTLKP